MRLPSPPFIVDISTTTKAVQKLEKAGYVIKAHPDNNRKSLSLYPTEKAKQIYENIIKEENVRSERNDKGNRQSLLFILYEED